MTAVGPLCESIAVLTINRSVSSFGRIILIWFSQKLFARGLIKACLLIKLLGKTALDMESRLVAEKLISGSVQVSLVCSAGVCFLLLELLDNHQIQY